METEHPRLVVTTVVVDHAVLAPLARNVAEDLVSAHQVAQVETVEMMDAVVTPVAFVLQPKPVLMEFAREQPLLIVPEDHVVPIVLVEAVDLVQLDRDAARELVNVTMIVTKEIVVMLPNLKEPTPVYALKDLVELAPLVSLADPMADVQHQLPVLSPLQSLTVQVDVLFPALLQLQLAQPL